MLHNNLQQHIRQVAVLGAGVMGAQIAALFVNAGLPVILFDLPSLSGNRNALVANSIKELLHLQPAPLALNSDHVYITAANYQDDLTLLSCCQLVIEAIAERLDWKRDVYQKILPYLADDAILASNTSGLSINSLASILPAAVQKRFLGMHFFNPPRYMPLIELAVSKHTLPGLTDALETFLVRYLGKIVVRVKDTPNFIANRIGVFSLLATIYHAERYNLGFDVVDTLTGLAIDRPKSATLCTLDVIGLDTFAHTITTLCAGLPDDPWRWLYVTPSWLQTLVDKGYLGQKKYQGIYHKKADGLWVYDINKEKYRLCTHKPASVVSTVLALPTLKERLLALKKLEKAEAQFLWAIFRDLFHYCALHLTEIADNVRDIDLVLCTGFAWQQGPFSTWQSLGWFEVIEWLNTDIKAGKTLSSAPLPEWVYQVPEGKVYTLAGAYSPLYHCYRLPDLLPVYQRQLYPAVLGIKPLSYGKTVHENAAVRLWHDNDDIAVLSFNTKLGTLDDAVIEGILLAVDKATRDFKGLIIGSVDKNYFSAGANLHYFLSTIQKKKEGDLLQTLSNLQQAALAIRYALIPIVAVCKGYVLGGGCELMMHATSTVAALDCRMGLVEASIGLLPAGGGCKELALRAGTLAPADPYAALEDWFKQIALGGMTNSALEARHYGYLRAADPIVMNPQELFYIAKQHINDLIEMNYRPPQRQAIRVMGRQGASRLQSLLNEMQSGQLISEHDKIIASKIARIITGGDVEALSYVDEQTMLQNERDAFMELTRMPATIARIEYFLKTGKRLKN